MNYTCNLISQIRWNGITYLMILLCSVATKKIVIRKGLNPSCLSNCQASALMRVIMNKSMTIF